MKTYILVVCIYKLKHVFYNNLIFYTLKYHINFFVFSYIHVLNIWWFILALGCKFVIYFSVFFLNGIVKLYQVGLFITVYFVSVDVINMENGYTLECSFQYMHTWYNLKIPFTRKTGETITTLQPKAKINHQLT